MNIQGIRERAHRVLQALDVGEDVGHSTTFRLASNAVDLINEVERLQKANAELFEKSARQPTSDPCAFGTGLAERVAMAWFDAAGPDANPATRASAKTFIDPATRVLAELAKAAVELPTVDELMVACGYDQTKSMTAYDAGMRCGIRGALETIGARFAPILAAQLATIEAAHARVADLAVKPDAAEVLRGVRGRIESARGMPATGLVDIIERKHALAAVDDALTELEGRKGKTT